MYLIKKIFKKIAVFFDFLKFKKLDSDKRFALQRKDFYFQIGDKTAATGFDRHYIYHTAWASRKIKETNPSFHIDIASSLYFCALVSAFVPIKFYDYRTPDLQLPNLEIYKGDLMNLPFSDNEIKSLSCMHVVEHIGLGRYGDPIDPSGDLKAIKELKRVLAKDGNLFFVTPLGKPKIQFNAHRIYSLRMIKEYFSDFKLQELILIPERKGPMILNPAEEQINLETYGCGCFWFLKK